MKFPEIFVCATREKCEYYKHVNAPAFRRSFTLAEKPESAEILICGLGFYDLFVNGERITKGLLAPYISNPDDYTVFDKYDVADKLTAGENVIGVVLGNGMQNPMTETWEFSKAKYASAPKLALSFTAKCGGETVEFDATSFKWAPSPITFDNHRLGVHYDARLEQNGWCEAGFDDSDWSDPLLAEIPRGEAKLCDTDPIVV
ncbi:MAG: alpha-L-rhamnosidase N-terminal domain-containing protein, partial [Clostridia bacterium]|nr:alpha-L-rhamnosidase N-terminal domain-containing protein [Clostridia bacterium]